MITAGSRLPDRGLIEIARAYVDRWFPQRQSDWESVAAGSAADKRRSEVFGRRVADHFDRAPLRAYDDRLASLYQRFQQENLRQYEALIAGGLRVEPWLETGQPYRDSAQLSRQIRATRVVHVFLTEAGHGPTPASGDHPMRQPSGITVSGVAFTHNDIFRAVHDAFGHVMLGNTFSARGEFKASHCHLPMYSHAVRPVLFTEQIAQVCWYFFGPKSGADTARTVDRYPEQKLLEFPASFLNEFEALFAPDATEEPA